MKKNNSPSRLDVRIPLTVCVLIGIFMLALYTVLSSMTDFPPLILGIVLTALYVYVAIFGFVAVKNRTKRAEQEIARANDFNKELSQMFNETVDLPYAVVDPDGTIAITNSALSDLLGQKLSGAARIEDFCSATAGEIIKASEPAGQLSLSLDHRHTTPVIPGEGLRVSIRRRRFTALSYPMAVRGKDCHLIVFTEITELVALEDKMKRENPVVAFIVIDNLEELAQYVRVSYRAAANEIEAILKKWATEMNGIIREYDRDKYVLFISQEKLEECVKNKFEILDTVRDVRLGDDNMSVTVSMGIFAGTGTLAERESEASTALELALGRGGDQVALRRGGDTEYFGGRSKSIQKRTRVRSRVNANVLCNKIAESSNIIVMGHKNPDFDCIGSCIGIARLAMYCGVPVKIVSDLKSESLAVVLKRLSRYEEYRDMFIDALAGLDLVRPDTLLIICDANNFKIIEAPEIADNVDRIAIIDHHRQTAKFDFEPLVNYIDPAASSACELVSEVLEQSMPNGTLLKDEATAMLAGIMLDTKHFSKETGTRTFSAALYLQNEGAKPDQARAFFDENIDEFLAEAKFSNDIEIYRDKIAITRSDGTGFEEYDRTAASKAADKLLAVRQVEAAFALVRTGNTIRISARSSGKINVQLILEQLGGGGHFEAAGAQLDGAMDKVYEVLTEAIDKYLNEIK
ncbi:MAG: DHH family phosphoesterase [Clostridia bacterium]|nr:DHH family phosphoesterase [Clostridia bacterium]